MNADRYVPETPFPPYAFVPGRHPHPVTDAHGHSFGRPHVTPEPFDPDRPMMSHDYLFAIDLFNAGFYWEAHEAWEGLWIAAGRTGRIADFLKALIKLAAAGVKAREGQLAGMHRHARRATELFRSIQETVQVSEERFAGLRLSDLIQTATSIAEYPIADDASTVAGRVAFPFQLTLDVIRKTST